MVRRKYHTLTQAFTASLIMYRRVLMYPSGNDVDFVSLYLEAGPKVEKEQDDWYACAELAIVLWNPSQPSKYVSHGRPVLTTRHNKIHLANAHLVAKHRFYTAENDWGFTKFSQLKNLFEAPGGDPNSPLLENGEANITAYVRVVKDPTGVLWHNFLKYVHFIIYWNGSDLISSYNSKKATGMVGLRNQGSTGYLNVVLQALYLITATRKVRHIVLYEIVWELSDITRLCIRYQHRRVQRPTWRGHFSVCSTLYRQVIRLLRRTNLLNHLAGAQYKPFNNKML